jgi:hypothetical protein
MPSHVTFGRVATRKIIKVAVSESAKQAIESVAGKHDMKEMGVASRVYEWFAAQEDVVQKGILRLLPEGYEPEVVRLVLQRIGSLPTAQNLIGSTGTPGGKKKK